MDKVKHFAEFLNRMELPEDGELALSEAGRRFSAHMDELEAAIEKFYCNGFCFKEIEAELEAMARKTGLSRYTVDAAFVMYASARIKEDFESRGIQQDIFWDTMMDLQYKLKECKTVKGVWGTFVLSWYRIFFELKLYKLGRMEFESQVYSGEAYEKGGFRLEEGDRVYSVHIPSCGPLTRELRLDSYKRAFDFFSEQRNGRPLFCICDSWLLFKGNREIFPPESNLVDFLGDWDIIKSVETEKFDDAWRVFGADYSGDASLLPRNTAQQKALSEWLSKGKKTGLGFGVLIFDGKEIVK